MSDQQKKGQRRRAGCLCVIAVLAAGSILLFTKCNGAAEQPAPVLTQTAGETAAPTADAAAQTMPETQTAPANEPPTQAPTLPSTQEPTLPPTEAPTEKATVYPEDPGWELRLVNSSHPVPEGLEIPLTQLSNGVEVDSRMYPHLQEMFDDMRSQGIYPFVREGYRTPEYQRTMMQERINEYLAQGYSEEGAQAMARDYVAEPGTSEHELGLAVDINAADGTDAWTVYSWLAAHAQEYGFILRYPEGKTDITGIAYEPWHYRYVGVDAAEQIMSQGLTLEEYLGQ